MLGLGRQSELVKCLLQKNEDWRSIPSTPVKSQTPSKKAVPACITSPMEAKMSEFPELVRDPVTQSKAPLLHLKLISGLHIHTSIHACALAHCTDTWICTHLPHQSYTYAHTRFESWKKVTSSYVCLFNVLAIIMPHHLHLLNNFCLPVPLHSCPWAWLKATVTLLWEQNWLSGHQSNVTL